MPTRIKMLAKLLTEIKTYVAVCLGLIESFYGSTYPLISSLLILGIIDMFIGYYKNKKVKGEKFKAAKLWVKFVQVATFLIALTCAIVCDKFFQHYGLKPFFIAESVCSAYGIWQFLHIIENLGDLGLPIVDTLKDLLRKKITKDSSNEDKE